jgi:predicted nucleic acid-binding protein
MNYCLDTSVLVSALIHDDGTKAAQEFLISAIYDTCLITSWAQTETASAIALLCRRGTITRPDAEIAWKRFVLLRDEQMIVAEVIDSDFRLAADFCLSKASAIRAGDAVHLAVCSRLNSKLVSFDRKLCRAAREHNIGILELYSK